MCKPPLSLSSTDSLDLGPTVWSSLVCSALSVPGLEQLGDLLSDHPLEGFLEKWSCLATAERRREPFLIFFAGVLKCSEMLRLSGPGYQVAVDACRTGCRHDHGTGHRSPKCIRVWHCLLIQFALGFLALVRPD